MIIDCWDLKEQPEYDTNILHDIKYANFGSRRRAHTLMAQWAQHYSIATDTIGNMIRMSVREHYYEWDLIQIHP